MSRMYQETKTWNPFKGCEFDCVYCRPSFQLQAKRQKHNCIDCYNYRPHYHSERLEKIPSAKIVFVCGNGDISFCEPEFTEEIINSIKRHNQRRPDKVYYFQSKKPEYFEQFLGIFPKNVILISTLETNIDEGYEGISKAPLPTKRYEQFRALDYPRKVVTIEPVMKFDLDIFADWILKLQPEYVWFGLNSRHKNLQLPEPAEEDIIEFLDIFKNNGIPVKLKELRSLLE